MNSADDLPSLLGTMRWFNCTVIAAPPCARGGVYGAWLVGELATRYPAPMSGDASTSDEILFDVDDGILRITLNRPDMGNAVTQDQRRRLTEWIDRANEDDAIRCVVLGATGRFFCTGADLSAPRD